MCYYLDKSKNGCCFMIIFFDFICVGVIVGVFGVYGEVCFKSFIVEVEVIVDYVLLMMEDGGIFFDFVFIWLIKNGFVV